MSPLIAAVTDPTVPDSAPPSTFVPGGGSSGSGIGSSVSDIVSTMIDNLGHNGYQTGVALITATVAVVAMLNIKVNRLVLAPVAIGAFWAGWLGWNTFTGQDNPLFPGDVSATKLWDIAFNGDMGFLLVVAVACVAAVFLWRKGVATGGRVMMLVGSVLGASFVYNLVQAFRAS
jgi:hypothetical protein